MSSPGLLIIIGALSLVLVATVIWGFIGKIPVTTIVTGCVVDSESIAEELSGGGDDLEGAWVICFVDSSKYSADQIRQFGDDVTISMPDRTNFKGKVETVTAFPLSRDEAYHYLRNSEWIAEQCVSSDYSWGIAVHVHEDISSHLFTTPRGEAWELLGSVAESIACANQRAAGLLIRD